MGTFSGFYLILVYDMRVQNDERILHFALIIPLNTVNVTVFIANTKIPL